MSLSKYTAAEQELGLDQPREARGVEEGRRAMEQALENTSLDASTSALRRSVRLIDLVMIGAGTAIGASIFSVLGPSARVAGSGILVAVLIAAVPMTIFGLIYAFMSSAWPRSGASYEWQRTFVHPMAGFIVVWLRIMGNALLMSVMGSVLVNYLSASFTLPIPGKAIVFIFFTIVFLLNYVGVAVAARAQTIVMLLLLSAFSIFVASSAPADRKSVV